MLLYAMKEVVGSTTGEQEAALIDALARDGDGALLDNLLGMLERVEAVAGGP